MFLVYFVKLAIIRNRFKQANKRPTTQHVLIDVLRLFFLFNCVACASLPWHWKREEPLSSSQHCILKTTLFRKWIFNVQFLNFMVSEFYSGSPSCNNLSRQKLGNPCRDTKSQQYIPNASVSAKEKQVSSFSKFRGFCFQMTIFRNLTQACAIVCACFHACVLWCVRVYYFPTVKFITIVLGYQGGWVSC